MPIVVFGNRPRTLGLELPAFQPYPDNHRNLHLRLFFSPLCFHLSVYSSIRLETVRTRRYFITSEMQDMENRQSQFVFYLESSSRGA